MNENNKIYIEYQCINYLKEILSNHFDIKKMFDGCKADLSIKPKNVFEDSWLGIQVKSTFKKVKMICKNSTNLVY
jgi:hypothetical protein